MYNLTTVGNFTSILGMTQNVNTYLMGGWLGTLILLGLYAIIFISSMYTTGDMHKAVATASFIGFVLSLALSGLGLIPPFAIFLTLIGAGIGVATLFGSY